MDKICQFRQLTAGVLCIVLAVVSHAAPSVYPTGTTIYEPDKAWNGYTVFGSSNYDRTVIIDMNGRVVKEFPELSWGAAPPRVLPGGYLLGGIENRLPLLETYALEEINWDGKVIWRFDRTEQVKTAGGKTRWAARQHHDWQREGSPAGYYSPGSAPLATSGRTLILAHKTVSRPDIADKPLEDDYIQEVSWDGKILWDWLASDHIDEFGFSADARNAIRRAAANGASKSFDWSHLNSMSWVGPNRWYDAGDRRFKPDNIIISSRQSSIIAIISRDDGSIVWRMGPDYSIIPALRKLGQIIGQHHPHIIPGGLPGAGNLLVFDNGGASGYGFATPAAPDGVGSLRRQYSRVLEINPVTFAKVWEYSIRGPDNYKFFSHYISSAQRLPNGNTLITEGADGRLFEVTDKGDIVWEYVSPYFSDRFAGMNSVYRAYRVPYDWIPQVMKPEERRVVRPDLKGFHIAPE